MVAPLSAVLCGVLRPLSSVIPTSRLDVGTVLDTQTSIDFDVRANDPIPGTISTSGVASGPGSVSVVSNSLRFFPGTAGISVIPYTSTVGALSDQSTLTVVTTSAAPSGSPPTVGATFQRSTTGNLVGFSMPVTTPPNTRGVLLGVTTWLDFSASEPQTITPTSTFQPPTGPAVDLTRIDTFGDQVFTGDPNFPTSPSQVTYTFLLRTPVDTIPASGNLQWFFGMSAGAPEVHAAIAMFITHPDRDLDVTEIAKERFLGGGTDANLAAAAGSNSLLANFSSFRGQAVISDDPTWNTEEFLALDDAGGDILSVRLLGETKSFVTAGDGAHNVSSNLNQLRSAVTFQFQDPLGGTGGVPAVANNIAVNATTGGASFLIDVVAQATGTAPITLTAAKIISGDGAAILDSNQVRFTPPSVDGVTEIEIALANAGGPSKAIITVTSTTVSLGPRSGFGVGLGQTGTLASVDLSVQAALGTFEADLRAKNDRGKSDAQIITENPGFTTLTGKTLNDLNNALNSGNRRLFLTAAGGPYTWTTATWPDFNDIELVGLADAGVPEVVVGGTIKNVGQVRSRIRGLGGRVEGIKFRDGAICFSFVGATGAIPRMHVTHCQFENLGNSVHHDYDDNIFWGRPNAGARCDSVIFDNNLCEDVHHGINMRCGPGWGDGSPTNGIIDFGVGSFQARETLVKVCDSFAIACHLDARGGDTNNVFYAVPGSVSEINDCLVDQPSTLGGFKGFTIAGQACETANYRRCFTTNGNNNLGLDHEAYTKSKNGVMEDCVLWNVGQSNSSQGIFGLKGEGNGNPLELGKFTLRNNMIGNSITDVSVCIFVQRSNSDILENVFVTSNDAGRITQQASFPYGDTTLRGNLVRSFGGGFAVGGSISNNTKDWLIEDEVIELNDASTVDVFTTQAAGGGKSVARITYRNVTFRNLGGATGARAINIEIFGSNSVSDILIENCAFENMPVALRLAGNQVQGFCIIRNCTHTGAAPAIQNTNGTTLTQSGNSF